MSKSLSSFIIYPLSPQPGFLIPLKESPNPQLPLENLYSSFKSQVKCHFLLKASPDSLYLSVESGDLPKLPWHSLHLSHVLCGGCCWTAYLYYYYSNNPFDIKIQATHAYKNICNWKKCFINFYFVKSYPTPFKTKSGHTSLYWFHNL